MSTVTMLVTFVHEAVTHAVILTGKPGGELGEGTVGGAVKMAATPLAV